MDSVTWHGTFPAFGFWNHLQASIDAQHHIHFIIAHGLGGGQVVGVLTFYSDNLSEFESCRSLQIYSVNSLKRTKRNKRKRKKLSGFLGPGWLFHQINAPVYCKLSWRLVRFTGWKNMSKSFVGLESPDTFVVPVEGCDTALLPQRPQLDSTVWTAGNALKINKTSVRSDIINWTYCIDFSILA